MKLQPLAPWWLILPYALLVLGAVGWQLWRVRHAGKAVLLTWIRRTALLVCLILLALGPSVPGGSSAPGVANLDVLFAVDTTPSMGAQDYAGTQQRLDGIKSDMLALAAKLQGAHFEIITFDTQANIILPFSTDSTAFGTAVQGLTPQVSSYSQGSAIDKPLPLIVQELKNSKAVHPERNRLLFYLSDGEQTADAPVASFSPAAPYVSGGAVLGYGTAKGAKMLKYNDTGSSSSQSYIMTVDPTTDKLVPAISRLDETALKKIASQLGVTYQNRDQGGPITSLYQASKAQYIIDHTQHVSRYLNLYWLFAIPLGGLLFWEWKRMLLTLLELRTQQGGKHA